MAPTQAQKVLEAFEDFLKCLDLESYQENTAPSKQ